MRIAGAALAVFMVTACEPTVSTHGHVWRGVSPEEIQPGVDTRETVLQRLGSPSAEGLEENVPWIYVTERELNRGVRPVVVLEQLVVVIRFDSGGTVVSVSELGPQDRIDVSLSDRETPTRGQSLNLLQQLLGNIGRFQTQ